jgi:hypothetical protein
MKKTKSRIMEKGLNKPEEPGRMDFFICKMFLNERKKVKSLTTHIYTGLPLHKL